MPARATRVVLTDFGLAKDTATGSRYTRSGTALGTPAYMSPEQARGDVAELRPASDVWALGCLLHELLSGGPSFEGLTPAAVVGAILTHAPPPLHGVPSAVRRLRDWCLEKDARDRPRSAAVLRDACERALAGRALGGGPRRRRLWGRVALGAALAAGAGIAALWLGRGGAAPPAPATPPAPGAAADRLAAQAWARRHVDVRAAIDGLGAALHLAPAHADWRLRLGLLHWAIGDDAGATAEWSRIGPDDPAAPQAALDIGLLRFFSAVEAGATEEARFLALCDRPDRVGRVAAAALALGRCEFARARALLQTLEGWEANTLTGLVEGTDPDGDRDAAVRAYTRAIDAGLPTAFAHNNRGAIHRSRDALARALADFDAALRLAPTMVAARANRGSTLARLGRVDEALAELDALVAAAPDAATAWQHRALVWAQLQDWDRAHADQRRAVQLDPTNPHLWNVLTGILERRGDVAAAERVSAEAVSHVPTAWRVWHNWVRLLLDQGRYRDALQVCERALEHCPDRGPLLGSRGLTRRALGDPAGALADLERAATLEPEDAGIRAEWGVALAETGTMEAALATLDAAVGLDPGNVTARQYRAVARARAGNLAGTVEDLTRALELEPRTTAWLLLRGRAHETLGHLPAALADYVAAAGAPAPDAEGWARAARVAVALGDAEGARRYAAALLAAAPHHHEAARWRAWLQGPDGR